VELYKYMTYRDDFFTNRLLRFSSAIMFNDPFEGLMSKSSVIEALYGRIRRGTGEIIPRVELENTKLFSNMYSLGILSLTCSKHSLRMWAHYANNHTGIILCVDSNHPFFNQSITPITANRPIDSTYLASDEAYHINASLLGKVYPIKYERIRLQMTQDLDFTDIGGLLQKSDEWIYEKEYRMFMRIKDGKNTTINPKELFTHFELPEKAINKIILGVRSDKSKIVNDFKNAIQLNPNLSHIKLESTVLHKDLYHIEHLNEYL
jgi:hypothetical protein